MSDSEQKRFIDLAENLADLDGKAIGELSLLFDGLDKTTTSGIF